MPNLQVTDVVTITQGVYAGLRGVVATIEADDLGVDVAVRVQVDPKGLFPAREIAEGLFVHVEPTDLTVKEEA